MKEIKSMPVKIYDRTTGNLFKIGGLLLLLVVLIAGAQAQRNSTFTSGSTGADGALDYSVLLPNGGVAIFDPTKFNPPLNPADDNIFNFTTINIPANVTVRLSGRVLSGPVYWLASGDVTIGGVLDLRGEDGDSTFALTLAGRKRAMPGAGGFSGGVGGQVHSSAASSPVAQPGDGPGGGQGGIVLGSCVNDTVHNVGQGGSFTGNSFLAPLIGGSGGGGGNVIDGIGYGTGGGAGGGAILIASATSVTVNGGINADGGNGGFFSNCNGTGGGGSGGAIRLASPALNGNGSLSALGGLGSSGRTGSNGAIRLEAITNNFSGTFNSTPFTLAFPVNTFLPASGPPSIAITNINGTNISQPPTGNLATPDVSINTTSPVSMTIQAKLIPPGTIITLHVFSDNTDQAVQTTPLVGTLQSSTATADVTFPSGFSLQFVKATWTQ